MSQFEKETKEKVRSWLQGICDKLTVILKQNPNKEYKSIVDIIDDERK